MKPTSHGSGGESGSGEPLVISAAAVAAMVGVSRRSIERAAHDPASPYHAARVVDGIASLRFRRVDILRIVGGTTAPSAAVLPMRRA